MSNNVVKTWLTLQCVYNNYCYQSLSVHFLQTPKIIFADKIYWHEYLNKLEESNFFCIKFVTTGKNLQSLPPKSYWGRQVKTFPSKIMLRMKEFFREIHFEQKIKNRNWCYYYNDIKVVHTLSTKFFLCDFKLKFSKLNSIFSSWHIPWKMCIDILK